ncbi:MAG: N-6 DNA methylase [Pseudolabrys sp.]|nr:N-6 DNA methylase [Pseudolabrys sp.]
MSEELRQRGYLSKGRVRGVPVGPFEAFDLGNTTFDQLKRVGLIPDRSYGKLNNRKPDGIVVDRRGDQPLVKFVVDFKDRGVLDTPEKLRGWSEKVADEYCRPLSCEYGGVSDHKENSWILVSDSEWQIIRREDDYPLDSPIDFATEEGRALLARTLHRFETSLNKPRAALQALEAVNPTNLADQTWQDIWLACGQEPEACLATFIEFLIFKYLSDLNVLKVDKSGVPVDFHTVLQKDATVVLPYYFDHVRPAIKELFPAGADGTSVINGMVLSPNVKDQGRLLLQIFQRFEDFGSLRRIDPEFKSRIFERFLKKSLSVKNWGQYFTPRNVIKAMVEMSGVERLPPGAVLADPACGVGGFLLEPLMNKRPYDFRSKNAPNLRYVGWDRDDKTIILAKANMLVHLSDVLEQDAKGTIPRLAKILNETFQSKSQSITGSLAEAPVEKFDLVMTNPPYVTRGTGTHRAFLKQDPVTGDYYSVGGSGIENLFIQLIVNGLKPGARALVVVPDGLLLRHSETALKSYLLKTCDLEAIVSLPKDTFYSTPKKTYILIARKKQVEGAIQRDPVFSYLVTEVGETRDAKRFVIPANDLPLMAERFRTFQGNPAKFETDDPRCKVFPIDAFVPSEHWLVNKWWSREERERLGDVDEESFVGPADLGVMLAETGKTLNKHAVALSKLGAATRVAQTVTVSLADKELFAMGIGLRVLKRELFNKKGGTVPLYSANVEVGKEHGFLEKSNLENFSHPSLLWSIDSDFNMTVRQAGDVFATTDHCGRLEILNSDLDPVYCHAAIIYGYGRQFGFDRVTRPSLQRMRKVTFRVPVKADGSFDLEAQRSLAREYMAIQDAVDDAKLNLEQISDFKPRAELPLDAIDLGDRETLRDVNIAKSRLEQIEKKPRSLVSGRELKARLGALN